MSQAPRGRQGASRRRPPSPRESRSRWLRSYAAGVATGVVASLALYLLLLPPEPGESLIEATAAPGMESAPQPQFEFYRLLPRQTVEIPQEDSPAADESRVRERSVYLLQAGSFRQAGDADQRRAELLLLGLEPRIEQASGEAGTWHRVYLGPFESRSAMARARSLAAQQNIDTLVLRRGAG